MDRRSVILLGAVLLMAGPACAQETAIPDAGGWKMVQHAPPAPDPPCFARIEGPHVNTSLLLTRTGAPIVALGRGREWSNKVQEVVIAASVDGAPALQVKATVGLNLVLVEPSEALLRQLHHGEAVDWTFPFGRLRGRIAGFDAALAAVKQCVLARDGGRSGT